MQKTKTNTKAESIQQGLQKRLANISDHSKDKEVRRSAISAICVELLFIGILYKNSAYTLPFMFVVLCLSIYHIIRMILQVKKAKVRGKDIIIPNAVITGFHLMVMFLGVLAFIGSPTK